MGTNYYVEMKSEPCPTCGLCEADVFGPVHIGKSSAGWCFGLRVYPDDDEAPSNLEEWISYWTKDGREIRDEYNEYVPPIEMLAIITDRKWKEWDGPPSGYDSIEQFMGNNHAAIGPNNLWRHQVEPGWCVGPGPDDATYDLMIGEFS